MTPIILKRLLVVCQKTRLTVVIYNNIYANYSMAKNAGFSLLTAIIPQINCVPMVYYENI